MAISCVNGTLAKITQKHIIDVVIILLGPNFLKAGGKITTCIKPFTTPMAPKMRPTVGGGMFKPPADIGTGRKTVRMAQKDMSSSANHP